MSKVLLQIIIKEIWIKKVLLLKRQMFFYRKLLKLSLLKRFFYLSKVLLQKIIEEILIEKVLLHIKSSFTENHRRNLDQKGSFTGQ